MMIESGSKELSEEVIVDAIKFGHKELQPLIDLQEKMAKSCGKKKREYDAASCRRGAVEESQRGTRTQSLNEINRLSTKEQREEAMDLLAKELVEKLVTEDSEYTAEGCQGRLKEVEEENVRKFIIEKKKRVDGRRFDEVRQITCEVGVLPQDARLRLIYARPDPEPLGHDTLGTSADEQMIDALEGETAEELYAPL